MKRVAIETPVRWSWEAQPAPFLPEAAYTEGTPQNPTTLHSHLCFQASEL